MAFACAYDRNNDAVYVGDQLVESSGGLTLFTVIEIVDEEHVVVEYRDRPERFGAQMGYTSGSEEVDVREFLLSESSRENRKTVTLSYIASLAEELEVPEDISEEDLKILAFQLAISASDALSDQPLEVEVDEPSGNIAQQPGWYVPSEYLKGWIDLDSALS